MKVAVRLFAGLRELAGTRASRSSSRQVRPLPTSGPHSTSDRSRWAARRDQQELRDTRDSALDGDEVALIPPVSAERSASRSCRCSDDAVREVASDDAGAIATFTGTTRAQSRGREVVRLEYEAYEGMAEGEMERIAADLMERHSLIGVAIHHRVGVVGIGETSVVIAVSSAHRADALAACAEAIDALKGSVPLWKKEIYVGGEEWIGQGS